MVSPVVLASRRQARAFAQIEDGISRYITTLIPGELATHLPISMQTDHNQWARFARSALKAMRGRSVRSYEAFLAEAEVYALLETHSSPSVRVIRAWEAAPVDGAILVAPETITTLPPIGSSFLDLLEWAQTAKEVSVVTFDVKSICFRPNNNNLHVRSGLFDIAYGWSTPSSEKQEVTDVIIVQFEGIFDRLAIVPVKIWQGAWEYGYGIEPLVERVPGWAGPFLVQHRHLGQALFRLTQVTAETPYINPTLHTTLDGFRPTVRPQLGLLFPTSRIATSSLNAILQLRQRCKGAGEYDLFANPIQPLLGDFLLSHQALSWLPLIEHKRWTGQSGRPVSCGREDEMSPFAFGRQWHFLFLQHSTTAQWICIPRSAVKDEWRSRDLPMLAWDEIKDFCYEGDGGFSQMLLDIGARAEGARKAAQESLRDVAKLSDEALISSSATKQLRELRQWHSEEPFQRPEKAREFYLRGLPWLSVDFNQWCCREGHGLVATLPDGHPNGTHLLIDYDWPTGWDFRDGLPCSATDLWDRTCIVLRFADVRSHPSSALSPGWPVFLSRPDWLRPGPDQHFFYVGSMLDSAFMEDPSSRKSYWVFPSELLTQLEQGLRQPNEDKVNGFWRRVVQTDDQLPHPKLHAGRRPTAVLPTSGFLAEARGINPARYIVDADDGSLYRQLLNVLRHAGTLAISGGQSTRANWSFDVEKYHTKVWKVQQAAWDFGRKCWRPCLSINSTAFADSVASDPTS